VTKQALDARSLVPSLTVNDLQRSIRFYSDGLGFSTKQEMKDGEKLVGVILEGGGALLGLTQDDFAKGRDRVKGVGLRLWIETDQDVETMARQAKAAGLKLDIEAAPLPWGPMGFAVTDPDGYKLTVSNPSQ
jgi:lactoylglutathione lyase